MTVAALERAAAADDRAAAEAAQSELRVADEDCEEAAALPAALAGAAGLPSSANCGLTSAERRRFARTVLEKDCSDNSVLQAVQDFALQIKSLKEGGAAGKRDKYQEVARAFEAGGAAAVASKFGSLETLGRNQTGTGTVASVALLPI